MKDSPNSSLLREAACARLNNRMKLKEKSKFAVESTTETTKKTKK